MKQNILLIRNDGKIILLESVQITETFIWFFKLIGFVGYFEVIDKKKIKIQSTQKVFFWEPILFTLGEVLEKTEIYVHCTWKQIAEEEVKYCYVINGEAFPIPGYVTPTVSLPLVFAGEKKQTMVSSS